MSAVYDARFYDQISDGSLRSAREVLGFVFARYRPASMLDIGCGVGTWVAAGQSLGIALKATLGVDGAYVRAQQLRIDSGGFHAHDLAHPLNLGRRFDLVVSVEVAEHLPPSRAATFVEDLVTHGDTIVFSAAAPEQGGANHINEQWPDYWAAMFAAAGFLQLDVIRPAVWSCEDVAWWYRQNTMLYTSDSRIAAKFSGLPSFHGARLVHPDRFAYVLPQQVAAAAAKKLARILRQGRAGGAR